MHPGYQVGERCSMRISPSQNITILKHFRRKGADGKNGKLIRMPNSHEAQRRVNRLTARIRMEAIPLVSQLEVLLFSKMSGCVTQFIKTSYCCKFLQISVRRFPANPRSVSMHTDPLLSTTLVRREYRIGERHPRPLVVIRCRSSSARPLSRPWTVQGREESLPRAACERREFARTRTETGPLSRVIAKRQASD